MAAGVVALVYTGVIYNSAAIIVLAFSLGALLLLSYLYAFCMLLAVHCRIQIPISMAEQGGSAWIEAVTVNRSPCQLPKLQYILRYGNVLSRRRKRMTVWTEAGAKETGKMSAEITCRHGGCYSFRLRKVRIYGWFGIIYVTKYIQSEAQLNVMPQIVPLNVRVGEASRHFMGEAEVHDDRSGGDDVTEVFQIRPFREGDRLQSIHWKLSAKEDELMVKENSLPLGCPVVILLELQSNPGILSAERRLAQFFETVLSLSFALMEQKCSHYIAWFSHREQDVVRVRVDKEEKVYYALLMLYGSLQNTAAKRGRNRWVREHMGAAGRHGIRELYQEKYRGETWITEIRVAVSGEVTLNGEAVAEELAKTELRV